LAQLSFNKNIALDINKDAEFRAFLDKEAATKPDNLNDTEFNNSNICKQIDWNIKEINEKKPLDEFDNDKKHIMISYNTDSRGLCLQVKSELEASGYKVWMDVSDIHGSSLDSMAKAVEGACAVLICVTEKYRQSLNCQSEAQYAYKCGRPIIPCIMQQGYQNVTGWLGIIMGDKIFINFMKYDFSECMRRLKGEVNQHYTAAKQVLNNPHPLTSATHLTGPINYQPLVLQNKVSEEVKWNAGQVEDWFNNNKLSSKIFEHLHPCDGGMLKRLFDMKRTASAFYYQILKDINGVDTRDILMFSSALEALFN
jgi:hypothetical protein